MVTERNLETNEGRPRALAQLRMPTVQTVETLATASLKRTFGNGHAYHINSLSFNSDGETYPLSTVMSSS